jgi:hypothetical protein
MKNPLMQQYRSFLKDTIRKQIDFSNTDQNRGIDPPPIEKSIPGRGSPMSPFQMRLKTVKVIELS